ncbi:PfkB family carbohydrate kinase [Candidatus Omnitrophota bacterium]
MSKILVIGSVALDTIRTSLGISRDVLGGSAMYFSVSASFFAQVNLVATVGKDFPDKHRSLIKSFGVNINGLETKEGKTFRWEGSYVDDLNCAKTINTQLNVFADFKPEIPREYRDSKFLFLANIDPDLQLFILRNFKHRQFVGCDSMNYWIQNKGPTLKRLMKETSIIFLNDAEAKLFSGETNVLKAGRYLISLGPRFAIIKRGEYGAILFSKGVDTPFSIPAYLLDTISDPTGAGDTFAGGFMGYMAKTNRINDQIMRKSLLYGSTMASFTVENFSINRFLTLKRKNIEARYKRFEKSITL